MDYISLDAFVFKKIYRLLYDHNEIYILYVNNTLEIRTVDENSSNISSFVCNEDVIVETNQENKDFMLSLNINLSKSLEHFKGKVRFMSSSKDDDLYILFESFTEEIRIQTKNKINTDLVWNLDYVGENYVIVELHQLYKSLNFLKNEFGVVNNIKLIIDEKKLFLVYHNYSVVLKDVVVKNYKSVGTYIVFNTLENFIQRVVTNASRDFNNNNLTIVLKNEFPTLFSIKTCYGVHSLYMAPILKV